MCIGTVFLLVAIYLYLKFQVNLFNNFQVMLRTKMWDGRTDGWSDGRTETRTISWRGIIWVSYEQSLYNMMRQRATISQECIEL
jgi:hypothetical protein